VCGISELSLVSPIPMCSYHVISSLFNYK
jgi:hypothetical protein